MSEARSLDDNIVREIAMALILRPLTMEIDENYRRIKEGAAEDFIAIHNQVYQFLVVEDCAAFGGIAGLEAKSFTWILKNVDALPYKFKEHTLKRAIGTRDSSLVNLALESFNRLELSQHTTSIETLMHEILKGDYDEQIKKQARILRDKANDATALHFRQVKITKKKVSGP